MTERTARVPACPRPTRAVTAPVCKASGWCSNVRSNSTHDKQDHNNDQDDANDTDAAITESVTVAAEAAAKAA